MTFHSPVDKGDFAHGNYAQWSLDISGNAAPDRTVFLERRRVRGERRLYCIVFNQNGHNLGKVRASINGAKVECRLGKGLIPGVPRALSAFSTYNGNQDFTNLINH